MTTRIFVILAVSGQTIKLFDFSARRKSTFSFFQLAIIRKRNINATDEREFFTYRAYQQIKEEKSQKFVSHSTSGYRSRSAVDIIFVKKNIMT